MIFLVRHGETEFNAKGIYQGRRLDSPLTSTGEQQARNIANELWVSWGETLRTISSTSGRAVKTAELILSTMLLDDISSLIPLKNISKKIHVFNELNEQDYGDWEGLTAQEIEARWPGSFEDRTTQGRSYCPPNGESYSDLLARIKPICLQLQPDINYLIVTHKRTSQAIREILFPESPLTEHTHNSYYLLDLKSHTITQHTVGA